MASRSRLGKGLGALFPNIPGDDQHDEQSPTTGDGSPKVSLDEAREKDAAQTIADDAAHYSSTAPQRKQKAQGSADRGTAAKRSTSRSSNRVKRASVPSLGDLTHPSDMFFGADTIAMPSAVDDMLPANTAASQTDQRAAQESGTLDVSCETSNKNGGSALAESGETTNAQAGAALPNEDLKPVAGGYLAELQVSDIGPNAHQPRTIFDEDELLELSESIKEVGVLQPIVVRKRPANQQNNVSRETSSELQTANTPYELIMGERRWRASQMAGLTTIPAIVKTTADDDMLRDALLENLHRVALNPLEEAAAYQQMIKEFGLTQQQLSQSVSKSRPQIANTLRLLQLPPSVQKKVASGVLSAGHARALLALNSVEDMDKLALRIIGEGLSVRSTEEIVAMMTMRGKEEAKAPTKRRANVWEGSAIQQSLENRFETKVAITGTKKHGRIEITFSSPEDMDRILALLNPSNADTSDGWM